MATGSIPLSLSGANLIEQNFERGYELYEVLLDRGFQQEETLKLKKIDFQNVSIYDQETLFYKSSIEWNHNNIIKGEYFCNDNNGNQCFYYENYERLDSAIDLNVRTIKQIIIEFCLALDCIHKNGYCVNEFYKDNFVLRKRSHKVEGCLVSLDLQPIPQIRSHAQCAIRKDFGNLAKTIKKCLSQNQYAQVELLLQFINDFGTSDTLWSFPSLLSPSDRIYYYNKIGNIFQGLGDDIQSKIEVDFMKKIGLEGQSFEWVDKAKRNQYLIAVLTYDSEKTGDTSVKYEDGYRQFIRFCQNISAHVRRTNLGFLIDIENQIDEALTQLCPNFLDVMHLATRIDLRRITKNSDFGISFY
ncbi:hypothetical protein AHAS_Ahas12G0227900 [Arachis hypogaea]